MRPNEVDEVKGALAICTVGGMTVTEVRDHERQWGHSAVYRGSDCEVSLLPEMKIVAVVQGELVENMIAAIMSVVRIGDGQVFLIPGEESPDIRTGERDVV